MLHINRVCPSRIEGSAVDVTSTALVLSHKIVVGFLVSDFVIEITGDVE